MSKHVITLTTLPLEAAVNSEGKLTELHYAAGPYVEFEGRSGEILLCGKVIMTTRIRGSQRMLLIASNV
jgi:hypothetical protein